MESLLNDYYLQSLHVSKFIPRKVLLHEDSFQLIGAALTGKTTLLKQYLLTCKKNSYLYLDCRDRRIDTNLLNNHLEVFCQEKSIEILVLDNYIPTIMLPHVKQLIIASELKQDNTLDTVYLNPLDYEEFLAYEPKFDSTVLNHFLQLGGYPIMHSLASESRHLYLQEQLAS
ncbi:MAG: ATP-binding protein, partial [Campylobacterota bacterium]|nr:ATP-binding protein [Campylobacterota bacterium]